MKWFLFTWFSLGFFIVTAVADEVSNSGRVSPETRLAAYRETTTVKQGVSADGTFSITETLPSRGQKKPVMNHTRTLRAFIDKDDLTSTIKIEEAKPHHFYSVTGNFSTSASLADITWEDASRFSFSGRDIAGTPKRFTVDLHDVVIEAGDPNAFSKASVREIPVADL